MLLQNFMLLQNRIIHLNFPFNLCLVLFLHLFRVEETLFRGAINSPEQASIPSFQKSKKSPLAFS